MQLKYKTVLVLAPHTDDGELGAGGFITLLLKNKAKVYYAAFSTAEESLPPGMRKDTLKQQIKNSAFTNDLLILHLKIMHPNIK